MIKNLYQLKDALSKYQGTWAWVGQRGIDAYTVLDFVPVEAVFCCDFSAEYAGLWAEERLFSVEQNLKIRENWGNRDLEKLWEGSIRKRIETYIEAANAPIYTVCYRSLAALEKDKRFCVLAPPLELKDLFDDKLRQLKLFSRLGVKTPATMVCRLGETTFAEAGAHMDGPFVVQPPVGSSGENTYFVKDEVEFDKVRDTLDAAQWVKLSKYIPVPSLNGHCIVLRTNSGLSSIAVCPSVQIVGTRGCTSRAEIYCGNDFSAAGRVPKGFLGIFGMDFLLNGDEVLALEINPRFQGSTMLLSLLQADRGELPLAALHVMQFMGLMEAFSGEFLEQLKRMYRAPYAGAHLIAHSLKEKPFYMEQDLKAGIYTLADNAVEWVRNGTTYRDVESPDEWCILGNLPLQATEIRHEARLAMIQTNTSILDSNLQQLGSYAAAFVKALQDC